MWCEKKDAPRKRESSSRYREMSKQKQIWPGSLSTERNESFMRYLRENGLNDDEPRFAQIVKLFREHGGKRL
jgi:hypothetical protein